MIVAIALTTLVGGYAFGQRQGDRTSISSASGAGYTASKLDALGAAKGSGRWLYTGKVPTVYLVLDLTGEQETALEELAAEGKKAYKSAQRELSARRRKIGRNREAHKAFGNEYRAKLEEIKETYATRMEDVLTPKQRETLRKIRTLTGARNEKLSAARRRIVAEHDRRLVALLSPAQRKLLEETLKPANAARPGGKPGRQSTGGNVRTSNTSVRAPEAF